MTAPHSHDYCPNLPKPLQGPRIQPLPMAGNENIADLIDNVYAASGFNGRRLAEAAQLFSRMIRENATIALTVSGAMTPIGMGGPIIELMRRGFIDFIISTGANLYHDLHFAFGQPVVQGDYEADDNELAIQRVARIYDVYIGDEETLEATDRVVIDAYRRFKHEHPMATSELHWKLAAELAEMAPHPERSFFIEARKLDIPLFTSSPGDSSLGMDLILPRLRGDTAFIDPLKDVIEATAIIRAADKNGVVQLGGGSPKNFYLQTQPMLSQILRDPVPMDGHDYFIQLTTDAPHWGGLSGATPQEARSWGKVKDALTNNVVVYSCASITFPLLAQYVLIRNEARPLKRLYPRLPELSERIRKIALQAAQKPGHMATSVEPD
ncbi:MAG: deoxyhypusine synthase [Phycisphaerae bacterium]|nr:deoxyhypusine synthase [Phycisphaerae bacterium]